MKTNFDGSKYEPIEQFCLFLKDNIDKDRSFLNLIVDYTNLINYDNKNLNKFFVIDLYKYLISFCDKKQEKDFAYILYKNYILFLLNNFSDPFSIKLFKIPSILENDLKAKKLENLINTLWYADLENNESYKKIINNLETSNELELLKFLYNKKHIANLNTNSIILTNEVIQVLQIYFKKLYFDGYTEAGYEVLNLLPKKWNTLWNKHLCNTFDNKIIQEIIDDLDKQKYLIENQNILKIQLRIKELINFIDTAFEDYSNIDDTIITLINKEVSNELAKLENIDDDYAISLFTKKLFKYVIFDRAILVLNSIPKKTNRDHRVAIYIDLKQIFETCLENDINEAKQYLEHINKILFEELKDKSSGTDLVIQMINNKNQKGLSQYIKKLVLILDTNSLEMENLFEALIIFISRNKINKKQYFTYFNLFKDLSSPQFEILNDLLITFNKEEEHVSSLSNSIIRNSFIFKPHSHTFYILIDAIFSKKLKLESYQIFTALFLNSKLNTYLSRNFIFLLIDYFYEQPYMDFKKDFPHITLNLENINSHLELLNETKISYFRENKSYLDFEDKNYALEKTKDYLMFLIKKSHLKKDTRYEHQSL